MGKYITKEAALNTIFSEPPEAHYPSWYAKRIKAIPTADVAPVVRGRWELLRKGDWNSVFVCSVCGRRETITESESYNSQLKMPRKYPYCHCGAKMYIEDVGDSDAAD